MAYKVIDVSSWQGVIDWDKVKKDGVVGAIVRYGDGDIVDNKFIRNMKECKRLGIHVGSYIYSRATTRAMARDEANRIIRACAPFSCDLPIYIDCEWSGQASVANSICDEFLAVCNERGVKGGIYANLNWFNNYINPNRFAKYPLWIAQYYKVLQARDPSLFGMWQYSSEGRVRGISGNVDMNHLYIAYWDGIKPTPTPAPIPEEGTEDDGKPLVEDGLFGKKSVRRMQKWLGTAAKDGWISGQKPGAYDFQPNLTAVDYEDGGSPTIKALQNYLKNHGYDCGDADGFFGFNTIYALQEFLNDKGFNCGDPDGTFGYHTAIEFQRFLNKVVK